MSITTNNLKETIDDLAAAMTHGEKWFRKEVETWRGLGGADISEDGHSETVSFRIGKENNLDAFMELLLAVAVNLRGISAELSKSPAIQSEA